MTKPPNHHDTSRTYEVVINGTPHTLTDEVLTYETLTTLAFPQPTPGAIFTVAYRHADAPRGGSGTLVAGQAVKIKRKGTNFDVRLTTRS